VLGLAIGSVTFQFVRFKTCAGTGVDGDPLEGVVFPPVAPLLWLDKLFGEALAAAELEDGFDEPVLLLPEGVFILLLVPPEVAA